MQLFSLNFAIGLAIVGILGRFVHTKTISVIMLVPVLMAVVLSFTWPESPSWLACKGEFDKCERAFIWLRGNDDVSKTELKELIAAEKENLAELKSRPLKQGLWKQITRREFYMPSLHILYVK